MVLGSLKRGVDVRLETSEGWTNGRILGQGYNIMVNNSG